MRMATTLSARLIGTHCRNLLHGEDGDEVHESYFPTLIVSCADPAGLRGVRTLRMGAARMRLDFGKGVVSHAGRHSDPLFLLEFDGTPSIELQIYDDPEGVRGSRLELGMADGTSLFLEVEPDEDGVKDMFESVLERDAEGLFLRISSQVDLEIVRQTMRFGSFEEIRTPFPAGPEGGGIHRIAPAFADYLGICVSSRRLRGAFEHKHVVFGQLGFGSGRRLLDRFGRVLEPKTEARCAYKAFLAEWGGTASSLASIVAAAEVAGADEVEIAAPAGKAAETLRLELSAGTSVPARILSYGPPGSGAELVVLDDPASRPPKGKPCSYLFLSDSDAPGWCARTAAVAAESSGWDEDAKVWERGWLAAEQGSLGASGAAEYGAGFSRPRGWNADRLKRARSRETLRRALPNTPCPACPAETASRCAGVLPFPYPGCDEKAAPSFVEGGACRFAAAFEARTAVEVQPSGAETGGGDAAPGGVLPEAALLSAAAGAARGAIGGGIAGWGKAAAGALLVLGMLASAAQTLVGQNRPPPVDGGSGGRRGADGVASDASPKMALAARLDRAAALSADLLSIGRPKGAEEEKAALERMRRIGEDLAGTLSAALDGAGSDPQAWTLAVSAGEAGTGAFQAAAERLAAWRRGDEAAAAAAGKNLAGRISAARAAAAAAK